MDDNHLRTDMLTNKEIVDQNLELIKTCIDCQFSSVKDEYTKQFKDDLFQDLIITLYEYDNNKLNNAYEGNHLNALISAIIVKSVWSQTSQFYRRYKKFGLRSDEISRLIKKEDGEESDDGGISAEDNG